jgi:hypothetical protein
MNYNSLYIKYKNKYKILQNNQYGGGTYTHIKDNEYIINCIGDSIVFYKYLHHDKSDIGCELMYSKKTPIHSKVVSVTLIKSDIRGAKNINLYVNGMYASIQQMKKVLPGWIYRIYIDCTIFADEYMKNIIKELNKNIYVQFVVFECTDYIDTDGVHKGLFGTISRYLSIIDPDVDYSVIRNIRSPIIKEDVCNIEHWISNSDKLYHIFYGNDYMFEPKSEFYSYIIKYLMNLMNKYSHDYIIGVERVLATWSAKKDSNNINIWKNMLEQINNIKKTIKIDKIYSYGIDEAILTLTFYELELIIPIKKEYGFFPLFEKVYLTPFTYNPNYKTIIKNMLLFKINNEEVIDNELIDRYDKYVLRNGCRDFSLEKLLSDDLKKIFENSTNVEVMLKQVNNLLYKSKPLPIINTTESDNFISNTHELVDYPISPITPEPVDYPISPITPEPVD